MFSLKRLLLLGKKDFVLKYRQFAVVLGAIAGFIIIVSFLSIYFTGKTETGTYENGYLFLLFVGGILLASHAFKDAHRKTTVHDWMTLPASIEEKILTRLVIVLIVYPVILAAGLFTTSLLSQGLNYLFFRKGNGIFNPFTMEIFKMFPHYISIQAIYFLGGAWFRKNQFIKTVFTQSILIIFWVIIFFSAMYLLFLGVDENVNLHLGEGFKQSMKSFNIFFPEEHWVSGYFNVLSEIAKIFYYYILPPFCWFTAYLRLKEQEVHHAV